MNLQEADSILKQRAPAWALRLLLGTAYFALGEVMLWNNPDPAAWPFRFVGCVLLAALALDLIVRFHIHDVPGLLMVSGVFGVTYGVLVAPAGGDDLLRIIVLRPLGWFSLVGGGAGLALTVLLVRGKGFAPLYAALAGGLGLLWGVWIHWFPAQLPGGAALTLPAALGIGAAALAAPGVVAHFAHRLTGQISVEPYLMMERWEWAVFGGGMAMLVGINLGEAISPLGVGALAVLGGFMIGVLYFMRARRRRSLVHDLLPLRAPNLPHSAALALIFLAAAAVGHLIPPLGSAEAPAQITWLVTLVYDLGFLWLPATAIIMAVRAFIDLSREGL
ncbi:MAG: hypothetical protein JXB47_10010 [Anaerolineae bacterium]|nr:hypothetical protein [Anaerolineae bacterium]